MKNISLALPTLIVGVAIAVGVSPSHADVIARTLSAQGDLGSPALDLDADGDSFPNRNFWLGDSLPDAGDSRFDIFGIYARNGDTSLDFSDGLPFDLADDSLSIFTRDVIGILKGGDPANGVPVDTTPGFFTADLDNPDTSSPLQQATWTFDISGYNGGLGISIDLAAQGDFENADRYLFEVSLDGGANYQTVLESTGPFDAGQFFPRECSDNDLSCNPNYPGVSSFQDGTNFIGVIAEEVDKATVPEELTYTLKGGTNETSGPNVTYINDPLTIEGIVIKNDFQTLSARIKGVRGTETELIVRFSGTSGANEYFGFREITIEDGLPVPIPEPAAFVSLALGAMLASVRRRSFIYCCDNSFLA